jgi:DNA-binding GntR family transcriptional regulator
MLNLGGPASEVMGRQRSTPDVVADVLRSAILRGELRGGQPLPQDEVALQFGLSRIPVREALRQLEGEGLVTFVRNHGAIVSRLSAAEIRELSDMRIGLETMAMRIAMPRLTDEALRGAAHILDEIDRVADPVQGWTENNWRFHSTLYAPAHRPLLLKTVEALHNNVARYLRLHVSLLHYKDKGQEEHRNILQACLDRDTDRAIALLERHIGDVATLLEEFLRHDDSEE